MGRTGRADASLLLLANRAGLLLEAAFRGRQAWRAWRGATPDRGLVAPALQRNAGDAEATTGAYVPRQAQGAKR